MGQGTTPLACVLWAAAVHKHSCSRDRQRTFSMADCPRLKIDGKAAVAFLCGAGALCFASIPLLSWFTKPLSAVGLIIGFFGCWLPARRQRADLWLPGAIVGLSALVLIFRGDRPRPAPAPPAPLVAISLDPEVADRQPIEESHWTDASTHAVSLKTKP